jgi:NAD(P)-dependent dehydrogenase (short-subunit alcohol dehydrogenase family)
LSNFEGKVALVTGAGSGMGRATAIMFAARGAKVTVSDYVAEAADETVKTIRDAGGQAIAIRTDVRVASQVEAMVKQTVDKFGRFDTAFNNAGKGSAWARLAQITEEDFDNTVDTNLKGIFLCMKYEIPVMQ